MNIFEDRFRNVVVHDDLTAIKELIKSKSNHTDLQKIYEMKVNKTDISTMVSCIDNMHKQLA